ncbi:MAG: hypothetical protein EBV77_10060, partial [Gemmatimonadaceae bacterium]|nr:hypothetical protein [Gemmatimonadaceae bacterium]
ADFPITVEVMSRFQTAAQQAVVVEKLKKKQIDIIIGTHRLLSPDVEFAELGLIIVDEEHRFGVKHKERLKQLKLSTDVLTLTATPIPRTLHQSLAGLRDLTLMQTAPRDRSPVLTFVEPFDDALIEEAISRELDRGGQVFFVHNRIETIEAVADHLRRIVPRATVAVGHGQMKERELERIMRQFVEGEVDILVSTLIVESGLDVPNANTMFVNRADHLGLAQLYQLRGRVGRSHRRAYCYLLVPDRVDEDAERRLAVLEHHTELGAGYRVALKDLELRGAGNLLGPEQSGFVHSVGFDLYLRLLDETVRQLADGDGQKSWIPADVNLDFPSYLPDDYIASQEAKLDVYRRLTALRDPTAIEALRQEVRDRFGALPAPAEALFGSAMLRVVGAALGVEGVLVRASEARITFRADAVPRLKGLSAAFHGVQFQVDVRRAQPLSIAELWVNYQLVALSAAKGDSLTDPKVMQDALWSNLDNIRVKKFYDNVSKGWNDQAPGGDEQRYNSGEAFAARHILIKLEQGATPEQQTAARNKAMDILRQATPANFASLAARSDEPGAKERGGDLGLFGKGMMVPEFEKCVVALKPGEISKEPCQTSFGFHIIYRSPFADVAEKFAPIAKQRNVAIAESTYLAKLESSNEVKIEASATKKAKEIAKNTLGYRDDNDALATYKGGKLTA